MRNALGNQRLVFFERRDPRFVSFDDRAAVRFDDAVEQLIDGALDLCEFEAKRRRALLRLRGLAVPQIAEHGFSEREQLEARLQRAQQLGELTLHLVAADRLAVFRTALALAQIVWVAAAIAACRPAAHQRLVAARAREEPAQRKVLVEVFARRCIRLAAPTILYALEHVIRNQGRVFGRHQMQVPVGDGDEAGIGDAVCHLANTLNRQALALLGWIVGAGREEAHDLAQRSEAARRVAFERFAHDARDRFTRHQHLAVTGDAGIAVADRRAQHAIADARTRPHPVAGLVGILLALVLRDRGEQVLDQLGVAVFAKLDRGRLQDAAGRSKRSSQLQMRFQAARQARDVINDDDVGFAAMTAQEGEHGLHAGTIDQRAGSVVVEGLHDLIALHPGEVFAAHGLRLQSVPLRLLLRR